MIGADKEGQESFVIDHSGSYGKMKTGVEEGWRSISDQTNLACILRTGARVSSGARSSRPKTC